VNTYTGTGRSNGSKRREVRRRREEDKERRIEGG
jgi:hypothetical protein